MLSHLSNHLSYLITNCLSNHNINHSQFAQNVAIQSEILGNNHTSLITSPIICAITSPIAYLSNHLSYHGTNRLSDLISLKSHYSPIINSIISSLHRKIAIQSEILGDNHTSLITSPITNRFSDRISLQLPV